MKLSVVATCTINFIVASSWLLQCTTAQAGNETNTCYANMFTADASANGYLEVSEFYTLVDLQACDAYTLPTDLSELNTEFQALACTSCIATGDGGLTCCFRDLSEARISIAGADDPNRSLVQQVSLDSICRVIDLIITGSVCVNTTELEDLIPPLDLFPTLSPNGAPETPDDIDLPGVDASEADQTCLGNLTAADADGDSYLNQDEFYQFIVLRGAAVCYEGEADGNLTDLQLGGFQSLACTSCLANNDGGITCCFRSAEEARISIAGAADDTASDVQVASLTSICTIVDTVLLAGESCDEDGGDFDLFPTPALPTLPPISVGFEDIPEDQEDCFADLAAADGNGDEFLSLDEFLNFVVFQGEETCYDLPSDTSELEDEFNVLACASCLATNDGGLTCCTRPTEEARISIAGAADSTTRTDLQAVSLIGICVAIQEGYVGLSDCEGFPDVEVTPSLPPIDVGFENQTDCFPDIVTADANADKWLNATEFLQLIVLRGRDICYVPEVADELTTEQEISFQALACTSCLANNDGGLLCCTRSLEEARISVSGAYAPEDNTVIQDGFLTSICTTVETLLLSEESACSETPIVTEFPPDEVTDTPAATTTTPETAVTESPLNDTVTDSPGTTTTPETELTESPPDSAVTDSPKAATTTAPVSPTMVTMTEAPTPSSTNANQENTGDPTNLEDTSGSMASRLCLFAGPLSVALMIKFVV